WTWLMPGLFGDWNHRDYWGHGNFWEDGFFIGVAGFVLACYGLSDSRRRGRKTLFFLVLLIAALACSRTFLFNLFLGYFPFFDHFRGAVKFNILITLFLIALAAMGMDRLLRDKKPSPWLMGSVGAAFLLFAGF